MPEFLEDHWLQAVALLSALLFVGTLAILPWLAGLLPEDYLCRGPGHGFSGPRSPLQWLRKILKNLAAVALLAMGIVMLVLPGQGLLTLAIGLLLLDFPGKRRLEQRLIGSRRILHGINWLRQQRNKPPLQVPEDHISD